MRLPTYVPLLGLGGMAALVLAQNLFGGELNAFFLQYPGIDKPLHVAEYFTICLCLHALVKPLVEPRFWQLAAVVGSVLLSIGDELAQSLAPGRSVEAFDLLADWSGVTLAWIVLSRPSWVPGVAAGAIALGTAAFVTYDTHSRLIDYSRALKAERELQYADARTHYLRALDAGLRSVEVYNGLAWVSIESGVGAPAEAVEYARRAYERRPADPDVLDTYGWALHHAGRSAEGLTYLEQAYAGKPDMYCIHYHLAVAYRATGRRELAAQHFRLQGELRGTREAALAATALRELESGR